MIRDDRLQPATLAQIQAFGRKRGLDDRAAAQYLESLRQRQLKLEKENALVYGYEPPVWYVALALLRNAYWSDQERAYIKRRLGPEWTAEAFADAMRRRLGFAYGVTKLLIMGSNRAAKTDFAAKLLAKAIMQPNRLLCWGAQTLPTQKKNQMPRLWKYLHPDLRARNIATKKANDVVENINYTEKNGFAGSRIVTKWGSKLDFTTYEQKTAAREGVEYDVAIADEEYPQGEYDLLTTRITSRAGEFIGTFTPLHGYTTPIATFLDSAIVTRWHRAYLRPKKAPEMQPWSELNLTKEEYEELTAWRRAGMQGDCNIPESRPEDCFEWLFDQGDGRDPGEVPDRRAFDYTPRVCRCQGGEAAAIWFYASDNPYGKPSGLLIEKMKNRNAESVILSSVYGMAKSTKGVLIKTFGAKNIVKPADIPKRLVRCMVTDPAPERNWVFGWFGKDPVTGIGYMLREWPGRYDIPGVGIPGEWAKPSDRNHGLNDGARGEGQDSFGFGYNRYKFEVARLERWKDYLDWRAKSGTDNPPDRDEIDSWSDRNGACERQLFRLVDSRAAAQSKISKDANQTLLRDLEGLMDGWEIADGQKTAIGYQKLIDLFDSGMLMISEECQNTIACLRLLTGSDGQKGAAKDLVDILRYFAMSAIWSYGDDHATESEQVSVAAPTTPQRRGARGSVGRKKMYVRY